jgi:hypothetical protein
VDRDGSIVLLERTQFDERLERTRWWVRVTESAIETWEAVSSNPDPAEDLGYDLQALSIITVGDANEQCMVMPTESDHLENDEFIVADPKLVCDLHEER